MADMPLAAFEFADFELGRLEFVVKNLGLDRGPADEGPAYGAGRFRPGGQDTVEIQRVADFRRIAEIDFQTIARLDAVLVAAIFENRKHGRAFKILKQKLWERNSPTG